MTAAANGSIVYWYCKYQVCLIFFEIWKIAPLNIINRVEPNMECIFIYSGSVLRYDRHHQYSRCYISR